MAGVPGIEPGMTGSKPVALPLGYTPTIIRLNNGNQPYTEMKMVPSHGLEPRT